MHISSVSSFLYTALFYVLIFSFFTPNPHVRASAVIYSHVTDHYMTKYGNAVMYTVKLPCHHYSSRYGNIGIYTVNTCCNVHHEIHYSSRYGGTGIYTVNLPCHKPLHKLIGASLSEPHTSKCPLKIGIIDHAQKVTTKIK